MLEPIFLIISGLVFGAISIQMLYYAINLHNNALWIIGHTIAGIVIGLFSIHCFLFIFEINNYEISKKNDDTKEKNSNTYEVPIVDFENNVMSENDNDTLFLNKNQDKTYIIIFK